MRWSKHCVSLVAVGLLAGNVLPAHGESSVRTEGFGTDRAGKAVRLYSLENKHGLTMKVTDYGGIITSLTVPDRKGVMADVVLGYDRLEAYLKATPYFGSVVGRYGNRIAGGAFELDGVRYSLATNNDPGGIPCHLHGGKVRV